jgi:hypothetical protein
MMFVLFLYVNNRRLEKMVSWEASWFVCLAKYYSGDQIMLDGVWGGGDISRMGERRDAYRVLMGKLEGKETTCSTWS